MSSFFDRLRELNVARVPYFNHDLNDWSALEWAASMMGEAGEAANFAKKLKRYDDGCNVNLDKTRGELVEALGAELADVIIYLDLLAAREGIDLEAALIKKFDEVSDRVGYDRKLGYVDNFKPTHEFVEPVVEAFRLGHDEEPDWFKKAVSAGIITKLGDMEGKLVAVQLPAAHDLEVSVLVGQYIFRKPDSSELTACSAEMFEYMYKRVD